MNISNEFVVVLGPDRISGMSVDAVLAFVRRKSVYRIVRTSDGSIFAVVCPRSVLLQGLSEHYSDVAFKLSSDF
jgi:hypothetical protein